MQNGTRPTRISKKDFDHFKSFGAVSNPVFPVSYNTDAGLTMPNQDIPDTQFTPPVPPLPFGCTDYAQSEVSTDLDSVLKDPETLDLVTGANAAGGYDIRASLSAAVKLGWFTGYFNVQPQQLDWFDTLRLAMVSGIPEKRSITVGTPWFPIFEEVSATGLLETPDSFNTSGLPWHNWKICGWKVIGDQTYLIGKSWQGAGYGDGGYCYWSRTLINNIMTISGTVAFTTTKGVLPPISTVTPAFWAWFISNVKSWLGFSY